MRVLVTGATGQLGNAICRLVPAGVELMRADRGTLDITQAADVSAALSDRRIQVVINCAAFTRVDAAEDEQEAAFAVNATGVRNLAAAARQAGARVLHFSTDYVFAGDAGRPYRTDDPPRPVNQYGATKLEGERALQESGADGVIIRTAWIYSRSEHSFLGKILARLRRDGEARVVDDQVGTPTSAAQLATFTWQLLRRPEINGCLHWTDGGVASWYDFAVAIAEEATLRGMLARGARVEPVASAGYPTRARRPAFSVLDKHATSLKLGETPLHWRQALRAVLEEGPVA